MPAIRSFLPIAAVAATLAAHCGSLHAQVANVLLADRHKQVDAILAPWAGKATPGCAVGISRDGVLDYAQGYGVSNLEDDIPIEPETVFFVASISKQFTAFSIGLLAQAGKLSLDDDIRKYLPELPRYGKTITISHLIHHTSGLREQGQLLNMAGWRGDDLYTEADILWVLGRQRGTNFDPGAEVVYVNAAYTLLGTIVRRVSGQSLRVFADERIFKPLGMADTRFRDEHTEMTPRRAPAYSPRASGGWRIGVPNIDHYGSTGLLTTVGDLLKWEQNLIDARVGGRSLIAWMRTSGRLNDGTETGYGGGLRLAAYRGLRMVSHDGADGGYRADAILFPDQRLAVVALCNGATITPDTLTRHVADVYLADRMATEAPPPAVRIPDAEQAALAGTYWSPATDEIVRLEWRDAALRQIGVPGAFVPIGGGVFRPGDSPHRWQFIPPATGSSPERQPRLHIVDFWPTTRVFTRVAEPMPTLSTLISFAGRYHSDEVDMTYTVRVADGKLALRWPRRDEVALEAVGGDRFVAPLGTVTFTRAASGGIDGLTVSNRRLRRLRAERVVAVETPRATVTDRSRSVEHQD